MEDREIVDLFFQRSEDAMECVNDACLGTWNAIPPARPAVFIRLRLPHHKESGTYQGKIYFFPNELAQDGGPALYLRKSSFTQEEAESFDGDLFSLGKYFEEGKVFLDASADYDFAETFGYSDYQGVLFTSDGNALNPLEEERCVRWLRLLNEYKAQITQKAAYNWDFSLSLSFPGTGIGEGNRPEDFYVWSAR